MEDCATRTGAGVAVSKIVSKNPVDWTGQQRTGEDCRIERNGGILEP
jgi:hypothetical protein